MRLSLDALVKLDAALAAASYSYCGGSTHNFYHYPARFSPDIARTIIDLFSQPGDVVLDPFMGGGTSIIEGLSAGRRMVGIDVNALAHFVATVRTSPLSSLDEQAVVSWASDAAEQFGGSDPDRVDQPHVRNLPRAVEVFLAGALALSDRLPFPRQRAFARCVLLRLGQWALDCRDFSAPRRRRLATKLPELTAEMIAGLREFVSACREFGVAKHRIVRRRLLLHRNAVNLDQDPEVLAWDQPRLVVTSPPYPSVHVLYHRWQYRGRKETAAPYWISRVPDGYFESYYTGGSRTPSGRERYFRMIENAFRSVRAVLHPRGMVVQLVGFSDAKTQLPLYLIAMSNAGFREVSGPTLNREVPNRKWYAKLRGSLDASTELLLLHQPQS